MARILLISANTNREPIAVYPLGMSLVAAALKARGHETCQIDLLTHGPDALLPEGLTGFRPDIVGISVRNIDNVDSLSTEENWYLSSVKALIADIRRVWSAPIVLGGPAVSIMPEAILNYSGADHCIVGEGEIAFNELIDRILTSEAPPRIFGPLSPRLSTPEFVSPCYEKDLVDFYMDDSGMVNYQTKRGCPFGCTYCSYPLIEGRKFRFQDPGLVVENLMRLKRDFGVSSIFFTDSIFNDPGGKFLEVAEAMARADLGMKWAGYFRPDPISYDHLELLKRSGLYAMEIGSDAACDTTLAGIGKTFDFNQIREFNEACLAAQIPCAHFFMFGGPAETRDTIREGLANIETLRHTVVSVFSGIRILPETDLADIARNQGMISPDDDLMSPRYYIAPGLDKGEMDRAIAASFSRRKDRIFPPEEGIIRMRTLKAFGFRGLLWDMILQTKPSNRARKE